MSKFDKLLERITSLSKDMRFDELRKVFESYGYTTHSPKGGITHSESTAKCPLQFQNMNQLKKYTSRWSKK